MAQISRQGQSVLTVLIALLGWGGLAFLIDRTSPRPYTWLLFLALLLITLIASFFLPLRYLYRRFARPAPDRALWQSFWLSLLVVLCAWLQMRRILDWAVILLIATVFGLIEGYLLSHE